MRALASGGAFPYLIRMPAPAPLEHPLEDTLLILSQRLEGDGLTLAEAGNLLGSAQLALLCLLLSVPFFQPFSLGPFTMVGGLAFIALGWEISRSRTVPTLPQRIASFHLRGRHWGKVVHLVRRVLRWCHVKTEVRGVDWCQGPRGDRVVGYLIMVGGGLLTIPFATLPFNNTFPAFMVFCAALAWLQKDSFLLLASIFWGLVTVIYFVATGWLVWKSAVWLWTTILSWPVWEIFKSPAAFNALGAIKL
jgi:hypothetical protein